MSPSTVAIRRARLDDAVTIATISIDGWREAYRDQMPAGLLDGLSLERRTASWARAIGDVSSAVWVAEMTTGELVGFAADGPARADDGPPPPDGAGEIYAIYVRPALLRRGIGRSLLVHATVDLAGRGFETAILWVLATNDPTRRFYEALGWTADGVRKDEAFGDTVLGETRYTRRLTPSVDRGFAEGAPRVPSAHDE